MSQRKDEFKQTPVVDALEPTANKALLAKGTRGSEYSSWQIHDDVLLYYKCGKLYIVNLENGKNYEWKGAPKGCDLAEKMDPTLSRIVMYTQDVFLDSESVNKFPVKLPMDTNVRRRILDSAHLICTNIISEESKEKDKKTEIYIFDKSSHFKKHVITGVSFHMHALCESKDKFKIFFEVCRKESNGHFNVKSWLYSLQLDVSKGIVSTEPVMELEIPGALIEGCQVSPDGQNIKIHYHSRFKRRIQIRKLDEHKTIGEPLLDFVVSHTSNRLCPYSSDGSFYYLLDKKIYRFYEGNKTFIDEFTNDCHLEVTVDDRLVAMISERYQLYSTPCYELNCKIKTIMSTILPRLQMPETEGLAHSKDVWSIIQSYAGFFKPSPLDNKSKMTGREMLKTAIVDVMPQLQKQRPNGLYSMIL